VPLRELVAVIEVAEMRDEERFCRRGTLALREGALDLGSEELFLELTGSCPDERTAEDIDDVAAAEVSALLKATADSGTAMGQKLHCWAVGSQYKSTMNLRYPTANRFEKHVTAASS
jgi:hypothetical protein